jgi:septum formation protein
MEAPHHAGLADASADLSRELEGHAIVLASASPRRRCLLEGAGLAFEVLAADIPEERSPGEAPADFARRLARDKAGAVALRPDIRSDALVIGADTIVVIDGDVLGKPRDETHAVELLGRISGREHEVITAVAVALAGEASPARTIAVSSRVHMRPAERSELEAYVATGEPLDKAGAYGLQGGGRRFVTRVDGSETNVIGLPLEETLALLADVARSRAR